MPVLLILNISVSDVHSAYEIHTEPIILAQISLSKILKQIAEAFFDDAVEGIVVEHHIGGCR